MNNNLNESFAKLRTTKHNEYWKRLVNTYMDRKIYNPSDYNDDRFKENDKIPFHMLKNKHNYDFKVVMYYLNNNYGF